MKGLSALVLAAGKGTRMKSDLVKILHPLAGQPMICWPISAARQAGASRMILVVGHQADKLKEFFARDKDIVFAIQSEQLGTGHAVACADQLLQGLSGSILILCGDVPLIQPETLRELLKSHEENRATITVLTTNLENPHGYGRVVKHDGIKVLQIVEEKDASPEEKRITEINSGIYCVKAEFLLDAVRNLDNNNAQGEFYLTDIIKTAVQKGKLCFSHVVSDSEEVMGVNDRSQLATAAAVMRRRINEALMQSGVSIIDPATAYIGKDVVIDSDTVIHPNVHISGTTVIGARCTIEPSVMIVNCRLGNDVTVKSGSVMTDSIIHNGTTVGPMAHLRPGTELGEHVKIGNFVETKKVVIGNGSKASHLTYLGDATIGENVNVGCGTITCNYDGVKKHRTVIEDDVFVGSDVQFVAPVTIGRNSLIAAGTTVTEDIPPDSLAIARTPQVNKVGWKLRKK